MGGSNSSEIQGLRVFKVSPGSPAEEAGLEVFFDFVSELNGTKMDPSGQAQFAKIISESENGSAKLQVFNTRMNAVREVIINPRKWGGSGLLGATVRYDVVDPAENHGMRVLEVFPNSPAAVAGLIPFQDYLLGTPQSVFHDIDELAEHLNANINKRLQVYVYNSTYEQVREVIIVPNNEWGGDGSIGCDIGTGLLHRIPAARNNSTRQPASQLISQQIAGAGAPQMPAVPTQPVQAQTAPASAPIVPPAAYATMPALAPQVPIPSVQPTLAPQVPIPSMQPVVAPQVPIPSVQPALAPQVPIANTTDTIQANTLATSLVPGSIPMQPPYSSATPQEAAQAPALVAPPVHMPPHVPAQILTPEVPLPAVGASVPTPSLPTPPIVSQTLAPALQSPPVVAPDQSTNLPHAASLSAPPVPTPQIPTPAVPQAVVPPPAVHELPRVGAGLSPSEELAALQARIAQLGATMPAPVVPTPSSSTPVA